MPFGLVGREHDLADLRAVRLAVVDAGQVGDALLVVGEAVVGEVEAAVGVEHQVVRRPQRVAVALRVQVLTSPVSRSTVWMRPPMYWSLVTAPGNVIPSSCVSVKRAPLLQT